MQNRELLIIEAIKLICEALEIINQDNNEVEHNAK